MPPFYVGQKVKYINNNLLQRNSIWTVKALRQVSCRCWKVSIGKQFIGSITCTWHPKNRYETGGTMWVDAKSFIPLDQTFQAISFKEVVEVESPLISINLFL